MDSSRGKQQHYLKNCKPSALHYSHQLESNNYNILSNHGIFTTSKVQKHSLKWRKDHYSRGNYRSTFPHKKNDVNGRKSLKSVEDVEEEERKKKLTDTAKQLLSKIKTWNAEKNHSDDVSQQDSSTNPVVSESNCKHNEEKVSSENKPKRIAHSKKVKMLKNRTPKSFSQPAKTTARYDVNKDTVKNFQNRIQHKLIEGIMQMPKENLQNVLNDPKINPIMELKMSRLVRENKLLIAQKLRALAESKIKSPGCSTNPQLLVDFDKLIDPVIETDLSVLPFELIKQMENVFQVQFDYNPNNADSQIKSSVSDGAVDNVSLMEDEMPTESEGNCVTAFKEDVSMYECSTDEDEELNCSRSPNSVEEFNTAIPTISNEEVEEAAETMDDISYKRQISADFELQGTDIEFQNVSDYKPLALEIQAGNTFPSKVSVSSQCSPEEFTTNFSLKEFTTTSCQTVFNCENALTQTTGYCSQAETLYGAPLPKEAKDESISSLLEEVNSIQNLTNKLNERRLMIFLQLANTASSGSFISDNVIQRNFIETVTNGSLSLIEALTQFFTSRRRHRSRNKKKKFSKRNTNKTKSGLEENKEGQETG